MTKGRFPAEEVEGDKSEYKSLSKSVKNLYEKMSKSLYLVSYQVICEILTNPTSFNFDFSPETEHRQNLSTYISGRYSSPGHKTLRVLKKTNTILLHLQSLQASEDIHTRCENILAKFPKTDERLSYTEFLKKDSIFIYTPEFFRSIRCSIIQLYYALRPYKSRKDGENIIPATKNASCKNLMDLTKSKFDHKSLIVALNFFNYLTICFKQNIRDPRLIVPDQFTHLCQ